MNGGAGPADGFEAAFDSLFPRALRLARRIIGDPGTAEDIAAEALARTYARWSKVSTLPWRDGWVLRVTTNLAIDRLRSHPTDRPIPPELLAEDTLVLRLVLTAALRDLPKRQREAIALHYLADLSDAQVAEALGVSVGTVKTHIHRGLQSLRSRLGPELEEVTPVAVDG